MLQQEKDSHATFLDSTITNGTCSFDKVYTSEEPFLDEVNE